MKKNSRSVVEFSREFKTTCDQLATMGKSVDDLGKLHWYLRGLGPDFSTTQLSLSLIPSSGHGGGWHFMGLNKPSILGSFTSIWNSSSNVLSIYSFTKWSCRAQHKYITETGLAMVFHSHVPLKLRVDALSIVSFTSNPTPTLHGMSPFEILYA